MDDQEYETSVAKYLVDNNPEYRVKYNQRIRGLISGTLRQVDVLLEKRDDSSRIVVECKYYNRKLTIKLVESFIGFLEDVGLSDGIIVTNIGVSKPAAKRVALSAIRIRVLSEDDLKGYKIAGLMPWQDNRMALLAEPNGWLFHENVSPFRACCLLTPIGSTLQESMAEGSLLYMNLADDRQPVDDKIEKEIEFINGFYSGKKTHKVAKDGRFVIRKSYLHERQRYDLGLVRLYHKGAIVIHGILSR
jgi:hypothetical protein